MAGRGVAFRFEGLSPPAHRPLAPVPSREIRWPGASCRSRSPPGARRGETVGHAHAGSTRSRCRTRLIFPGMGHPGALREAVRMIGEETETATDVKERYGEYVWPELWSRVAAQFAVRRPVRRGSPRTRVRLLRDRPVRNAVASGVGSLLHGVDRSQASGSR